MHGSRKRSPEMSEQFTFQQFSRNRRAGNITEWFIGPFAPHMYHARQNSFTRAAFTPQEDRGVRWCDLPCQAERMLHGGAVRSKIYFRIYSFQVFLEARDLLFELADFSNFLHGEFYLGGSKRFRYIVGGSPAHGFDSCVNRGIGCYNYYLEPRCDGK